MPAVRMELQIGGSAKMRRLQVADLLAGGRIEQHHRPRRFFLATVAGARRQPFSIDGIFDGSHGLLDVFAQIGLRALFQALGIFLPLITTNCAILGVALFQTNKGYGFLQSVSYALGAGAGFTLALVLMAGLRERLELAETPDLVRGTAITLLLAGLLSICFMGFAGLTG